MGDYNPFDEYTGEARAALDEVSSRFESDPALDDEERARAAAIMAGVMKESRGAVKTGEQVLKAAGFIEDLVKNGPAKLIAGLI